MYWPSQPFALSPNLNDYVMLWSYSSWMDEYTLIDNKCKSEYGTGINNKQMMVLKCPQIEVQPVLQCMKYN